MSRREHIHWSEKSVDPGFDVPFPQASELDQLALARLHGREDHGEGIAREDLVKLACQIYDNRRARARFFANSMLGEPVWDMLLALYCLPERDGERLSVSSLCVAAEVPTTTALRWVQVLESKGLVERRKDPLDGRRYHVCLSKRGEELMSGYLALIYEKMGMP